jgi:hypothetical protein
MRPYEEIKQDRLQAAIASRPKCGCVKQQAEPEPEPSRDTAYDSWIAKLKNILLKPDES